MRQWSDGFEPRDTSLVTRSATASGDAERTRCERQGRPETSNVEPDSVSFA
jgi:hypothetical protein